MEDPSGAFILVYLKSPYTAHELELTWLRDWDRPYNLGDNEFHLAFYVDDYEAALKKHKEMDVVAYENADMGDLLHCRSRRLLDRNHSGG